MKKFIVFLAATALLLSACGAKAEPTLSASDVQSTAEAAAWTMVAETQAAIPTNTPVPPTNTLEPTPLPTNTPVPLPTQPPVSQPTATTNVDRCNQPLPGSIAGSYTRLRFINETKAPVTLSLYLNETVFGECGYRSYQLNKGDTVIVEFVQGCYSFYAWINGNKPSTASGYGCANNPDMWNVYIRPQVISIKPP